MTAAGSQSITIIGGGPAGSLLAILLARRGLAPVVIERGPRFSYEVPRGGRSINLALAARGIAALRRAGIEAEIAKLMIPMRGRMVHDLSGAQRFLPYGQQATEEIYSVSRATLNTLLYELAAQRYGVEYRFGEQCVGVEADGTPLIESRDGARRRLAADIVLAADGAGSEVRRGLVATGAIAAREELLDHGYKELTLAARGTEFALEPNALHIWPRGGFMLIALPNPDDTFTATLFLARQGANSFEQLTTPAAVDEFFAREFPSARALIPDLTREFLANPQGSLGTVYTRGWHLGSEVLLLGDAAHAIVPFHGQGMNCAFEDCAELVRLMDQHHGWAGLFEAFEHERRPNTDAIAKMALENYEEMRADVLDPEYRAKKQAAEQRQKADPKFIPRYSMVMFHPEIPFREVLERANRA